MPPRPALKALDCAWQAGDEATRAAGAHSNTSELFLSFVDGPKAALLAAQAELNAALAS